MGASTKQRPRRTTHISLLQQSNPIASTAHLGSSSGLGEQEELTAISSSRRAANKGTAPLSLPGFRAKNRFLQQQDIVEREREIKEMRPIKEQEEDETRLRRERRSRKKNGRGGGVIMFDHYGVAAAARCFVPRFPGCGGWWVCGVVVTLTHCSLRPTDPTRIVPVAMPSWRRRFSFAAPTCW
jgi:hypothetical protein